MNKTTKRLLLAALALSASHLQAHTNKTTLTQRPHGVNIALESTAGWHKFTHLKGEDTFGGAVQGAFFYQASNNQAELGQYFGIKTKNIIKLGFGAGAGANKDIDLGLIIHDAAAAAPAAAAAGRNSGTLTLNPEQQSYGVYLTYHQDLSKILKGLCCTVALPVVHIENDPGLIVSGTDADTIKKYFAGELDVPASGNGPFTLPAVAGNGSQKKLEHALIRSKESATGPADVNMLLAYKILHASTYHASLNVGITIPTGNKVTGESVFEPIYGNGQHVGVGGGLDGALRVWGDHNHNVKLSVAAHYRYLLEAAEKRTLGIKGQDFGQYLLLGDRTLNVNAQQFTPAANVLTQNVNVLPGNQLDALLALNYNNGAFAFDLGYNFYYRQDESVALKDAFNANQFGIVNPTLATNFGAPFADAARPNDSIGTVNQADIEIEAAETPTVNTHKIYGGLGYMFKDWSTPLLLGTGGHYEFSTRNSALATWGVHVKAGVSF